MSRVGKLALVAVAVPVLSKVLRRVGNQMQQRREHPHVAKVMNRTASVADKYGRHAW